MSRKQKQYNFIYKTTCVVTGKYYIGMHSTDNLNDGYVGSGKLLWYSINKYGRINHQIEILEYLSSRQSLLDREKEIVNEELISGLLCINLAKGGLGNGDFNKGRFTAKDKNGITLYVSKDDPRFLDGELSGATKGYKHSEEAKQRMQETHKYNNHQVGQKNNQYGTCWIHNIDLQCNKRIKREEIEEYLQNGWIKGLKVEFNPNNPISNKNKIINFCNCGKIISILSKRCDRCFRLSRRKIDWPDMNTLKQMIVESNYSQVARELGVSDNAIRKRIKNNTSVVEWDTR
jgi:hypothetical protein